MLGRCFSFFVSLSGFFGDVFGFLLELFVLGLGSSFLDNHLSFGSNLSSVISVFGGSGRSFGGVMFSMLESFSLQLGEGLGARLLGALSFVGLDAGSMGSSESGSSEFLSFSGSSSNLSFVDLLFRNLLILGVLLGLGSSSRGLSLIKFGLNSSFLCGIGSLLGFSSGISSGLSFIGSSFDL